jgi:hypothetical protein
MPTQPHRAEHCSHFVGNNRSRTTVVLENNHVTARLRRLVFQLGQVVARDLWQGAPLDQATREGLPDDRDVTRPADHSAALNE